MQVTHNLGLGGLEQVVITLAKTLDPTRFDAAVLCLRDRGEFAAQLESVGVPVITLGHSGGRADYLRFRKVAAILRDWHADVVHSHNTEAFIDGGLGALLARSPVLVHTDHARSFPDKLRYMVAEHLLSYAADSVVGVSDHTVSNLHRYERIRRRKLVTVRNGIEGERFSRRINVSAKRRELGLEPEAPVIGFAGRLTEQKGLAFLLEALARVVKDVPAVTLLIAGDGPLHEPLTVLSTSLGLERRIQFLGVRHDIADLLQIMDVCVLPSIWEGLPMIILEAMASGCPVVASDVGGVANAVRHGVTGSLVPPRDAASLAAAIRELLVDGALRTRYAEAARHTFENQFSARAMARQYEALYLSHLNGR